MTWVSVPAEQFRITRGSENLARYQSSAAATRSFCRTCGSSLFFESERWPDEIHIARASVSGALDRFPQVHAFYSDKVEWLAVEDDLPRRGGTTGLEPL